ncbi:hypothetical protein C8Q76DRAFT_695344 [Earliella scabrosa]|nr:hypothetical protein C8Q76DRAFT_695344 [Earliella scabrosa]
MTKRRACRECRHRKVRCIVQEGATRCDECARRKTVCEEPGSTTNTPCETCKKAHIGCEWSGSGPCLSCARTPGAACSLAAAESDSDTPPLSPAASSDVATSPTSRRPFLQVVLIEP